jgi:hypothetical protein
MQENAIFCDDEIIANFSSDRERQHKDKTRPLLSHINGREAKFNLMEIH